MNTLTSILRAPILRYQADWRSILSLALLTFFFASQWTGIWRHWTLYILTGFLTVIATNVKHNHMHVRVFHSRWLNLILNHWLGFCTGTTATEIISEHNERHHNHVNEKRDFVRADLVRFQNQYFNILFFFPIAFLLLRLTKPSDLSRYWKSNRTLFWNCITERIVLYPTIIFLLWIDWKATVIYLLLPWLYGQWWLFTFNLFQHQGVDGDDPYKNSRNLTSFWFNWFYLNIGFHSAHHLKPSVHWSLLPELHAKEIFPFLPSSLDSKSMLSFYGNWFTKAHHEDCIS
jgi:fatty acid desaturase